MVDDEGRREYRFGSRHVICDPAIEGGEVMDDNERSAYTPTNQKGTIRHGLLPQGGECPYCQQKFAT